MPRHLKVAAVQMDGTPAPLKQRLSRAADLIAEAASSGAQLVALPEVFNTGYAYSDANYALSETIDGPTATWMKAQAAEHNVHLIGSLMLRDGLDVYNSALLVAPDGRTWRYDKNYPWAWERAYFREGHGVTVADTELGKFGMMICWDYAHDDLWQRYAGRVDALLIVSSPARADQLEVVFADGERVQLKDAAASIPVVSDNTDMVFGQDLDARAAWLGVPVVNTVHSGRFSSHIPAPLLTLGGFAAAIRPDLLSKLATAPHEVVIEADYCPQAKILNERGEVLARVTEQGDGFTLADVELADTPPIPVGTPPASGANLIATLFSDALVPAVTTPIYRQGLRKQFGENMAPVEQRTRLWLGALGGAFLAGWLFRSVRRLLP